MAVALPEGSLAGRDLSGRDLSGADLSGRDLAGADLSGANLDNADLSDANLAGCTLQGAGLRGTKLLHVDLTDAVLDDADLRGASLAGSTLLRTSLKDVHAADASFENAEWREATAHGGDWSRVNLAGGSMHRVTLEGVSAPGSNLAGLRLEDCDLRRVALDGAAGAGLCAIDTSFERVTLPGASLVGADLRFSDFSRTDLRNSDLRAASFESVDFRSPWLDGVNAEGATFERCAGLSRDARRAIEGSGGHLQRTLLGRMVSPIASMLPVAASKPGWLLAVVLLGALLFGTLHLTRAPRDARSPTKRQPLTAAQVSTYTELEQRFDREPGNRLAILLEMGEFLVDAGAEDEAETRLRQALELIERDEAEPPVEPVLALSDLLLGQERFDDGLAFSRELDQPGASPREIALSRLILAQTLLARGDAERAVPVVAELQAHIAAHPAEAPRFRLRAARVVEQVQGPQAALPLLEGVPASLDLEQRGEIDLLRASILARIGSTAAGLAAYDDLLLRLDDLPLLRERAREERSRLLRMGTDADAEARRLQELVDGDDRELAAVSAIGLARLAVRQGDVSTGQARYERALAQFGDVGDVRVRVALELSALLAAAGEADQGARMLRAQLALVTDPEQTFALRKSLAEQAQRAGDLPGALEITRATVAWAPNRSLALRAKLQLAGLADDAAKFDEAIDLYKEVALSEEDPAMTAAAWFGQATLMRRRGFPEAALPLMDSALMHLPRQHRQRGAIVVERAEVLAELGKSSAAEVEAMLADARAARLDTDQPIAYGTLLLRLGVEMAEAARHEDALSVFQQVASSAAAGEDPGLRQEAVAGQVAALVALGRQDQAQTLLDGVSLDSITGGGADETCDARDALARGRLDAGDLDAAVQAFSELVGACRSPRFLLRALPEFADALVERGAEAQAIRVLSVVRDDDAQPPVGRQIAALELGKLGSAPDLARATEGPDEALAALAQIETGRRLADAGELAQSRTLLARIADDRSMEAVPRGLARFELGMLAKRGQETGAAKVWFALVRDESTEGWLRDKAERELVALRQPTAQDDEVGSSP